MKTIRGITALLALFAAAITVAHIPYTVKSRDARWPKLDSYSVSWEPLWDPPRSEAPPSIRFDILLIEWAMIASLTALVYRVTAKS